MPELPEVETLRRFLFHKLINQKVIATHLPPSRLVDPSSIALTKSLLHTPIKNIARKGKYLLFEFPQYSLILHLGMSGRLLYHPPLNRPIENPLPIRKNPRSGWQVFLAQPETAAKIPPPAPHCYLALAFKQNASLLFFDPRTFGKIIVLDKKNVAMHPRIKKLGVDPLENNFLDKVKKFWPLHSSRPVKTFLMDQSFIAGIGNIYADESLFLAKIYPAKKTSLLTQSEWKCLMKAARKILLFAIEKNGTSFSDFKKPNSEKGQFQEKLAVYGREKLPCLQCNTLIEKMIVNQRSSSFCPCCQK